MELSTKQKVIGLIIIVAVSAAVGRYTAPEKIKIEKETITVTDKSTNLNKNVKTDAERNKRTQTEITEETRPDGTKVTKTKIVQDTNTVRSSDTDIDKKSNESITQTEKETKTIEYGRNKTSIALLAGPRLDALTGGMSYGIHIQKSILGPITFGIFGFTDTRAGISLGLNL